MNIMNILLICLVVTVGSFLLFNKKAMSQLSLPSVSIFFPEDECATDVDFSILFTISNWTVALGDTHFHWFLDGVDQGPVYDLSPVPVSDLSEGNHSITLKLANADHSFTGIEDTVNFNVNVANPVLDVKANGSDELITLGTSDSLSVNISLSAGSGLCVDSDWWVAAVTTSIGWYYFDASTISWAYAGVSITDLSPTYQGPLFDLSTFEVLTISGLPEGTYTLYFAVDTNMNGFIDFGEMYIDSVIVNITP